MRYEDWDVLLFPMDSKVPIKEFKTSCHVVHDTEFAYTHGSFGLPTMTCFMPGLSPGTPFNISLHCWKTPDISQFTRNYSKHPELVKFETRVLVDGRLVASSSFNRGGPWPQLINHSFEFTKNGDLEILKFPTFRSELLRQSYWSPADEVGRIKIVISEGFPRDSLTVPIERVKNIIAFSFQHAPIDILETSGIAWPNPAMWRRGPFNPTMPVPTQPHEDGPDAHLHSPRRRASLMKAASTSSGFGSGSLGMSQTNTNSFLGSMPNTQAVLQRGGNASSSGYTDPFGQQKSDTTAYLDWTNNFGPVGYTQAGEASKSGFNTASGRKTTEHRKISSSDASMLEYNFGTSSNAHRIADLQSMNFSGALEDPDISTLAPKAPANTPTAMVESSFIDELGIDVNRIGTSGNTPPSDDFFNSNTNFSSELATSLTHSLLNQPHPLPVQASNMSLPATDVKSRKENRLNQDAFGESTSGLEHIDMRKVSQSAFSNVGKDSRDTSTTNSPPSQRTFSGVFSHRSISGGEFGHDLTNVVNSFTRPSGDPAVSGNLNTDKFSKRTRHFTPASAKAIDDEDEPRRSSPRVRIPELEDQMPQTD
ncbi:Uu.00g037310.m01.CDS01 [Anthostomella pinea]|uniref:Uu.00g037310.m01.CDS01 n=1 Tax=Anthostomella pinea TaxID=933095 RepID=A0AAI8V9Q1_9PEZI|nr:Uu.00g037310.m01.CDS01 [Anthostomella pinea]